MDIWEISEEVYSRRTAARVSALVNAHEHKARYYKAYYTRMVNTSLLLAPVSGLLTTIAQYTDNSNLILILSSVAAYAAGIATSIIKVGHFETRADAHKVAAGKYQKLYEHITRELAIPAHERSTFTEYIRDITDELDRIYQEAPVVQITVDYSKINPDTVIVERKQQARHSMELAPDPCVRIDIHDPDHTKTLSNTTDGIHGILEYEQARHTTTI